MTRWTWGTLARTGSVAATIVLVAWAILLLQSVAVGAGERGEIGYDAQLYASFGRRFVESGEAYFPAQFSGSYEASGRVNLYPPIAMYLFVPFAYMPLVLWWAIPLTVISWHVHRCRPAWWSWPLMALVVGIPSTSAMLVYGNTTLWSAAIGAAACHRSEFAPLLAFKPTDVPGGIAALQRPRRLLVGLLVVAILALPFGGLWLEWLQALSNVEANLLRNIDSLPLLAFPLIAWVARRRSTDHGHQDHDGDAAQED